MKQLLIYCLLFSTGVLAQDFPATERFRPTIHDSRIGIAMRDGTELSLEIYRPADPQPRPTLYAAGPYPLDADGTAPDTPATGPVDWFVQQGYNYVLLNVRGTGDSAGEFEFMGREEQQDHYEIVEWIAAQPWSDGQVAGVGSGYYGNAQWQMAIQNPPHLSCIAPGEAALDLYRDRAWRGGVASEELSRWYARELRERHAYPANGSPRFLDFDLELELLRHRLPDAWWAERSVVDSLDQLRVPVFQFGAWRPARQNWLGALKQLDRMPAGTHTYIGDETNLMQNHRFLEEELLPFYRWCFEGRPRTGPALQPTLRYRQHNSGELRAGSGWPPANIRFTALNLHGGEGTEAQSGALGPDADFSGRPRDTLEDDVVLEFVSPALERDVDLAGPLLLELYASSDGTDTAFRVELYEERNLVRIAGAEPALPTLLNPEIPPLTELLQARRLVPVTSGLLKASVRPTTESGAPATPPVYNFENPQALYPGRVYRLDIELSPVAWRLRAGSRLVLKLSQTDDASLRRDERRDTLYYSKQYPTRLWLPLSADSRLEFVAAATQTAAGGAALTGDSIFILDAFTPPEPASGAGGGNAGATAKTMNLFDSDSPVIFIPRNRAEESR